MKDMMMRFALARAKEPSTWFGVMLLVTSFTGLNLSDEKVWVIVFALTTILGGGAMAAPERSLKLPSWAFRFLAVGAAAGAFGLGTGTVELQEDGASLNLGQEMQHEAVSDGANDSADVVGAR